jgi:small subunit ribosomal protein S21
MAEQRDKASGSKEVMSLTKVSVRDGEPIERALKRFKRKVEQSGVLKEVRKREHYLKPSIKKKLKGRAAEARARKREKRLQQKGLV